MPEFPLRLTPRPGAPRTADAWYLGSGDVRQWLAEIATWSTPHASVAMIPLSHAGRDLEPAGVLFISPTSGYPPSARCVAFSRIAPDIYVPADADVLPPLGAAELAGLLSGDYIHVWRPGAGLVAVERAEVLHAHDLLEMAPRSPRRWDRAVPGVAYPSHLLSITPIIDINLQGIFEAGRDDIGADAKAPNKLPKAPSEPSSTILSAGAQTAAIVAGGAGVALAKFFGGLIGFLKSPLSGPASGGKSGSAGQKPLRTQSGEKQPGFFSNYMKEKLAQLSKSLRESRHRELNRLIHMLEQEPDKGLRFAIPFSDLNHRGRANPGGSLMERLTEFSLRSLGGGGPADLWDVPASYQFKLQQKYRELANRETRLNRHRRAAYIFAELLGDFESAAAALRDGRHYREAAIIFSDRLKRPLDAASCLENGGLWAEAIAQYEQLQMHEKIGDLYVRLEDKPRANVAFQTAAALHRDRSDFISAARICEERLDDPDSAAVDLETGWLNSMQAAPCMRGLFGLLGRHGRHDAAADRAAELAVEGADSLNHLTIAHLLAEFAGGYPNATVREAAEESAKQVIGGRLRSATHAEADSLCRALARLAPEDELLDRDARRYVDRNRQRASKPPAIRRASQQLHVVQSWSFGHPGLWRDVAHDGKTLLAVGVRDGRIIVSRSDLEGHIQRIVLPWPNVPVKSDAEVFLAAGHNRGDLFGLWVVGDPPLPLTSALIPTHELQDPVSVGALRGTSAVFGAACDLGGVTWVAEDRNGAVVAAVGAHGELIATHRLPIESISWDQPQHLPLPMVARGDRVYVALSSTLFSLRGDHEPERSEMPGRIRSLCATAPHTLTRLAVGLDVGAQLLWDGAGQHRVRPFVDDMTCPVLGFNRGGYVVAASGAQLEVYDTKNGALVRVAAGTLPKPGPLAIFAMPAVDRFGVFHESGDVTIYQIGA